MANLEIIGALFERNGTSFFEQHPGTVRTLEAVAIERSQTPYTTEHRMTGDDLTDAVIASIVAQPPLYSPSEEYTGTPSEDFAQSLNTSVQKAAMSPGQMRRFARQIEATGIVPPESATDKEVTTIIEKQVTTYIAMKAWRDAADNT